MKRIGFLLCVLLAAGYARGQSFSNYAALNGTSQFGVFGSNVLSSASVFTVEFWIKTTESGTNSTYWQRPTMCGISTNGNASGDFGITSNNGYIGFWHGLNSSGDVSYLSATQQINNNAWHHIALVNNGTNAVLYLDGTSVSSLTSGNGVVTSAPVTLGGSALDFYQGGNNAAGINFSHQGQYAELRISSTARYSSSFTPATSFTTDASTISLLHFATQCGVKTPDASSNVNDLTLNAGVASCTTLPFTGDFSFNGTTQYGIAPAGMMHGLSTFTIEGWLKSTDLGVTPNSELWRAPNIVGNASNGSASGDFMITTQAGFLTMYTGLNTSTGDNAAISKAFVSDNQWHHWAVSANGTVARLFADGILVASLPINRALATSGSDAFGIMTNNSSCCGGQIYKHSGELDEVRFSNTARYTANFTPPTGIFANDAATVALYHLNGYNCASLYTPDASGNNDSMLVYGYASCFPDPAYAFSLAAAGNVTKAEYFIDTDPGFGAGSNITLTPGVNISSLAATINTAGLAVGTHQLYLRSQTASGGWSETIVRQFLVDYNPAYGNAPAAAGNVFAAEYFIDTDPGFGAGTAIAVTPAVNINNLSASINTAGLSVGIHRLYVRSRAATGAWSLRYVRDFLVDYDPAYTSAPPATGNVTKAEYFIDADPGFGSGTNIPLTAAQNISALSFGAATASLPSGIHRLCARSQNAAGRWSITNIRDFLVDIDPAYPPAPAAPANITKLEYFFDTDPGFGAGTTMTLTPAANFSNYNFSTTGTGSLSGGAHKLYIRSYDGWSLTSVSSFNVATALPISWLSFSAARNKNVVQLDWRATNEGAVAYYEPERSSDGQIFERIGRAAVQPAAVENTYRFDDRQPRPGKAYYRVRQVDIGGACTYSQTRIVNGGESEPGIRIFPNPAGEVAHIRFGEVLNGSIRIYDAGGAAVWESSIHASQFIDVNVSGLANGGYQLMLNAEDGTCRTMPLIIQH